MTSKEKAMKTAVEWLISEIQRHNDSGYEFHPKYNEKIIEQAKEMEKQQIFDAQVDFISKIITKEEPKIIECYFTPKKYTSSATICDNCGEEKFLHNIGEGFKTSNYINIPK
jgi:hypothetical protein